MWGLLTEIKFFSYNKINLYIVLASLFISLMAFVLLRYNKNMGNKKKMLLAYTHISALLFPIIFFMYSAGCRSWFYGCNRLEAIIYIGVLALISGGLTALLLVPFIFLYRHIKNSDELKGSFIMNFIRKQTGQLRIKTPKVMLLKIARPIAFSFSNIKRYIFISVGMLDILTRKEVEAVLLHETYHIKNKSPSLKFSSFIMRLVSPFSAFTGLHDELSAEEKSADMFVMKTQKTGRYLKSAKNKINSFERFT